MGVSLLSLSWRTGLCTSLNVRLLMLNRNQKYRILHRNHLLLVTNEDDTVIPGQQAQTKASVDREGSFEPLPSLVTQQEGDMT